MDPIGEIKFKKDTTLTVLKNAYEKNFQVTWLNPFGFNNSNVLAVNSWYAKQHHLKTLSNLKPLAPSMIIGVPCDFMDRPDGLLALQNQYHLNFEQIKQMEPSLSYKAIQSRELDGIVAFSTDARIAAYDLTLLDDDKHIFPLYLAAPLIRDATIRAHPQLKELLGQLSGKLTNPTMQALNYQVDVLKRAPKEVAASFLKAHHLVD